MALDYHRVERFQPAGDHSRDVWGGYAEPSENLN
jgi:hypothetical protein